MVPSSFQLAFQAMFPFMVEIKYSDSLEVSE
jgi:hypothetical protein